MNILAIIKRELRVLCRKRSVHMVRTLFTAAILLTWACSRGLRDTPPADVLIWMSIIALILFGAGAAIASSDAIGSERRNRTLGLLLLTSLRPLEVLFGKVFTCISQYLLCLVAILPVLALPLLGGGVEGSAVVRHFLGILAVSFLGVSVGLFASILCRRAGASASLSFATMLLLFLVPLSRAFLLDTPRGLQGVDHLWMGPLQLALHDIGLPAAYGSWSLSLTIVLGLGLGFLLSVAVLFPRLWHRERRADTVEKAPEGSRERRFVPIGDRENPFSSLRNRIGRLYPAFSGLVLLLSAAFALGVFLVESDQGRHMVLSYLFGAILLPVVYWKSSMEAHFPVSRLRQSGMLDLIRSTPLSYRSLYSGLVLLVRYPLLWNGFLLFSWNLVLLTVVTSNRNELSDHGIPIEFLIILHLGSLLILPVELLSLRIAGMWWGLRTGSPLRISMNLFLSHAAVPAVLLVIAAGVDKSSLPGLTGSWHLCRGMFFTYIFFWCRIYTRDRIRQGSCPSPPSGLIGQTTDPLPLLPSPYRIDHPRMPG